MTISLSKRQTIIIQLILWLGIFALAFFPIEFTIHNMEKTRVHFHHRTMHPGRGTWNMVQFILNYLLVVTLFYVNYFFLIPNYFSKRKFKPYLTISALLVLLTASIPLVFEWIEHHFHFSLNPREVHQCIISLLAAVLAIIIPLVFTISSQYTAAEKEKVKAELSFLRSQINHHFLFNSLNNIYALSIQESKHTSDAIYSLSSIMRHMATATATNRIELQQELDFLHHYIEIQKLRLSERTRLSYTIHGQAAHKQIGPMLLIPFIENCFKHGVSTSISSEITISLEITEHHITLDTKNTIIEHLDKENIKSGVGLDNVKKRLSLEYAGRYQFDQKTEGGFFITHLVLDLL